MNLIKHLHEAAHVKVFKDELSLMKIDFFDAIDDDEIDDDNLKVEFIDTYFNITKTSNGYKMERANDEVSLHPNFIPSSVPCIIPAFEEHRSRLAAGGLFFRSKDVGAGWNALSRGLS